MLYNPSKTTWMNPNIEYLFNNEIIEYDMKDAGFNLIQQHILLNPNQIRTLSSLEKEERHRAIGLLQRDDKEFSKALLNKFAEIRAIFISANSLSDNDIISVKKDAIFTIGPCNKLNFGRIEFVLKKRYSSYIRFTDNMNIEIYYNSEDMDIKGIGDNAINRHRLYIIEFIKSIISYLENKNPYIKRYLKKFINEYKEMKLEDEFYTEFNNISRNYNPMYNYQKLIIPLVQVTLKEMG